MGERWSWMLEAGEARYKARGAQGCWGAAGTLRRRAWCGAARGSRGIPAEAFSGASPAVARCHAPAEQRADPVRRRANWMEMDGAAYRPRRGVSPRTITVSRGMDRLTDTDLCPRAHWRPRGTYVQFAGFRLQ